MAFNLDDYSDVADRIEKFYEKHEDGRLTSTTPFMLGDYVVVEAFAYRFPEDTHPGHGIAWEIVPGKTSFTKDSEVMNAQTAAWGRAIVALGFPTKKIASKQEVQNRQPEAPDFATLIRQTGMKSNDIMAYFAGIDCVVDKPLADFLNDMNPVAQAALLKWAKGES